MQLLSKPVSVAFSRGRRLLSSALPRARSTPRSLWTTTRMALRFGRTPLIMACRTGDASAVDALLLAESSTESSTVNTADAHGFTPLYHAAMFGHVPIIERLLDGQGGDVEGAGESAGRADIGAADLGGLTPLHIACEKGRAGAAAALLAHGADAAAVDSIGRTPRDWAEAKGHAACVALF